MQRLRVTRSVAQAREVSMTLLRRRPIWGAAMMALILAALYWGLIASDRFVSEAHVIIQKTDSAARVGVDIGGLLGGAGDNRADQLLLRDYLRSVDMLEILDAKLSLRKHYSDWHRDPLSRMWFSDAPLERFYEYFLTRISVEYDDYDGVLVVRAQAYDAAMAQAIVKAMVEEGERYMNAMAHSLAMEQVTFLEKQVSDLAAGSLRARQAVLEFQTRKGVASPQAVAENSIAIINRLESQLSELRTRRATLQSYLMSNSPNIIEIDQQIRAVEKQIAHEQGRLISPKGKMLNRVVEEYQRLQMEAEFAQEIYKTALTALEQGRVNAARTLKKVVLLQSPTLPEYPMEPRRLYNITVFVLVTLMLAGILHLVAAIIRDHED